MCGSRDRIFQLANQFFRAASSLPLLHIQLEILAVVPTSLPPNGRVAGDVAINMLLQSLADDALPHAQVRKEDAEGSSGCSRLILKKIEAKVPNFSLILSIKKIEAKVFQSFHSHRRRGYKYCLHCMLPC
jgi:hypothetical protein